MRKPAIASLSVLAAAALFVLTACSSGAADSSSGSKETVKIGAWITTTGPIAVSGTPVYNGVKAYFDSANANGGCDGRKIDYITYDNAYDPQQTLQVAKKLVEEDGVVAIVGAYGTVTGAAALPYLVQSQIPYVNSAGTLRSWFEPPQDYVYGVEGVYEHQGAALGQWAAREGAKSIVVVHSDPDGFVSNANQVGPAAKSVDSAIKTTQITVKYHTTDYSPVVQQVKSLNPDAVVLILGPDEAAAYLQQAKLQGITAQAYGYAPDAAESVTTLAGDAAEGFRAVSWTQLPTADSPVLQEYRKTMAKYASDQPISTDTLRGYGLGLVFCDIISTIKGKVTPEAIVKAYNNTSNLKTGIYAPLTFSATQHEGTTGLIQYEVNKGTWTELSDKFVTPPALK